MKRKVELLSPVGNMETLYQAIHNGASAVYLGGKNFGARKFASNFTDDELIKAISYSHLYGVKVYITVNTIVFEDEKEELLNYVAFLNENGVDALIMQDMGMIVTVRKMFPDLEIHASTQCHNHNIKDLELMKSLGVKRVVLARELSLQQIKEMNVDIEKEVFVHGALCVSYSGCCLFSSLNGGRSGNRGECVGSCRLPYQLLCDNEVVETDGDYLLSTKELNTLGELRQLLDSGIDSLKIEGRMKSPYYVGLVTRLYRKYIDKYYNNEDMTVNEDEIRKLKKLFNRDFTKGYLFNDKVMNIKSSNHVGVRLGKVVSVNDKKIKIKLEDDIYQEDGIRFKKSNLGMNVNLLYNDKGLLVNSLKKGDLLVIDNKIGLKDKDIVYKTVDKKLILELSKYDEKKIDVNFHVSAHINNKLKVKISDGINEVVSDGVIIERALKNPTSKETITKQLAKLGGSPFALKNVTFDIDDNIFINIKDINEIRRKLVLELEQKRTMVKRKRINNEIILHNADKITSNMTKLHVKVKNLEQLLVCLELNVDYIYVTDDKLYEKYKNYGNVYLKLDRVINNFPNYNNENLLVTEWGSAYYYSKRNKVNSDYYLNVVNNETISLLQDWGVKKVTISPESLDDNMKLLKKKDVVIMAYGRMELMVMKCCPLQNAFNGCIKCHEKNNHYYLKDHLGNKFPIINNNCLTRIMHYKNMDIDINKYMALGFREFRLDFLDEKPQEVKKIILKYKR